MGSTIPLTSYLHLPEVFVARLVVLPSYDARVLRELGGTDRNLATTWLEDLMHRSKLAYGRATYMLQLN